MEETLIVSLRTSVSLLSTAIEGSTLSKSLKSNFISGSFFCKFF